MLRSKRTRLVLSLAVVLAALPAVAAAQSPYPARDGVVANGTDMALSAARINNDFSDLVGDPHGLEGLVLMVKDCAPDPEVYLDAALVHYGLATAPGEMYDDAIAWLVCESPRYVGVFWSSGNPHAARLDADAITDAMVEDLGDGNFTGAVVGGIDSFAADLVGVDSAEGIQLEPVPSGGRAPGPGTWLLAGAAAAGGAYAWRRRRGRNGATPAADETTPGAVLAARLADLGGRLTTDSPAQARLVMAYEPMGDEAILQLHRRHQAMVERLRELERQAEGLGQSAQAAAATGESATMVARYEAPLAEADALLAYVDGLEKEADHAETLVDRAPVVLVEARKAIAAAQEAYAAECGDFDLPPAEGVMDFPTRVADEAEEALSAGQRLHAGQRAEDATDLAERIARVAAEMCAVDEAIDRAAELFERIDDYAESSWADIRGNGSEAEESVDAAAAQFSRVIEADDGAFGSDAAAGFGSSLEAVFDELARARALVDAVAQRLEHIETAKRESVAFTEEIAGEIDEARGWLARPEVDRDVDPTPESQLDRAAALLDEARLATGEPTPDWIAIRRRLHEADRTVDAAVGGAREQQERMNALRRQLEGALGEAEAALDRVERYVSVHRNDIGGGPVTALGEAREAKRLAGDAERRVEGLSEAALADALRAAVEAWATARGRAEVAYDAAAADFAAAEKKRRAYEPRPSWMGPVVPMPMGRRQSPFPPIIGGWGAGSGSRPRRRSSWGSRPSGSSGGARRVPRSRPSGSRRGGGKGW